MAAAPTTELGQQIEIVLSITFLVIGVMFSFIKGTYSVLLWMLWPVITICRMLYQVFISGPYRVVAHIMHVLYPVATFCFAAACFGLLIGGFAGIASEAISSFFIAITWGGGGTSKVLSAVADTTPSQPPLVSATTSRSTTPRPVAERLMEFGRRKSKDLLPSALSSSASSIADQGGYFGEWTNHRASFRTRRLSYLDSEDMPDDDDGRSETSWDNDDDDTFTISPAHPTSRLRR